MKSFQYISDDKTLSDIINQINLTNSSIAIDTEFMRVDTFYPKLGLIQINHNKHCYLIDPLPLKSLCKNMPMILKDRAYIFHACGEDIEILQHEFEQIPSNITDTQILASFLDNTITPSYSTLLEKYLNIKLDKSETRTDWLARPLTAKQCHYAIDDVFYLPELAKCLAELVAKKGWLDAAKQETDSFIKRRMMIVAPENCYKEFKSAWSLNSVQLAYLKELAAWRLIKARTDDIAVNFIVKADTLLQLAKCKPKTIYELTQFDIKSKQLRLYGDEILEILKQPVDPLQPIDKVSRYSDAKSLAARIRNEAEKQAKIHELNPSLLVTKRIINDYIEWKHNSSAFVPELISGWREPLFSAFVR